MQPHVGPSVQPWMAFPVCAPWCQQGYSHLEGVQTQGLRLVVKVQPRGVRGWGVGCLLCRPPWRSLLGPFQVRLTSHDFAPAEIEVIAGHFATDLIAFSSWRWDSDVQGVRGHILSIFVPLQSSPVPSRHSDWIAMLGSDCLGLSFNSSTYQLCAPGQVT